MNCFKTEVLWGFKDLYLEVGLTVVQDSRALTHGPVMVVCANPRCDKIATIGSHSLQRCSRCR